MSHKDFMRQGVHGYLFTDKVSIQSERQSERVFTRETEPQTKYMR